MNKLNQCGAARRPIHYSYDQYRISFEIHIIVLKNMSSSLKSFSLLVFSLRQRIDIDVSLKWMICDPTYHKGFSHKKFLESQTVWADSNWPKTPNTWNSIFLEDRVTYDALRKNQCNILISNVFLERSLHVDNNRN